VTKDHRVTKVLRGREVLKDQQVQQDSKDLKEVRHRVLKDRKEVHHKVLREILVTHHKDHKEIRDPKEIEVLKVELVIVHLVI
jgi:hypothetical protein